MLEIRNLDTGYGKKQVLFDLSLKVRKGEIVALIGPNGAGKSTVLKAVCGLIPAWSGQILYDCNVTYGSTPAQSVARGIAFAPQGGRVFPDLSIIENLQIGGFHLPRRELRHRITQILQLFSVLKYRARRKAGELSGGEQQMLSLARALVPNPKLLLLDEPSLGLSPDIVATVFSKISEIRAETSVTILIVEQKVREVLDFSERVYSVRLGKVAFEGSPEELKGNKSKLRELFL